MMTCFFLFLRICMCLLKKRHSPKKGKIDPSSSWLYFWGIHPRCIIPLNLDSCVGGLEFHSQHLNLAVFFTATFQPNYVTTSPNQPSQPSQPLRWLAVWTLWVIGSPLGSGLLGFSCMHLQHHGFSHRKKCHEDANPQIIGTSTSRGQRRGYVHI